MLRLTGPQHALAKRLMKAGPRGLNIQDCHDQTLTALTQRGLAKIDNGRAVFTGRTKKVQKGIVTHTLLDLDGDDTPPSAA